MSRSEDYAPVTWSGISVSRLVVGDAASRPAVQKGGNTNERGDVRTNPGRRSLLLLTDRRPGIGLAGDGAHVSGKAPRSCRVSQLNRCIREDP